MGLVSYLKKKKRSRYLTKLSPMERWRELTEDEIVYWGLKDPGWREAMIHAVIKECKVNHPDLTGDGNKPILQSNIVVTNKTVRDFVTFLSTTELKFMQPFEIGYPELTQNPFPSARIKDNHFLASIFFNTRLMARNQYDCGISVVVLANAIQAQIANKVKIDNISEG